MWLDWDAALSILGHEVEIKETYASLLASTVPPDLFIDVGANYGLHSLLFLVHGVDVISFEPNHRCREYFLSACRLNGVTARLEEVALGDISRDTELWFPEGRTWLGSTDTAARKSLEASYQLSSQRVTQKRLDDYLSDMRSRRVLLKIDTEGSEYQVLAGSRRTLREIRPHVIFESWRGNGRHELFELFSLERYRIASLPWQVESPPQFHGRERFLDSHAINFIASPSTYEP